MRSGAGFPGSPNGNVGGPFRCRGPRSRSGLGRLGHRASGVSGVGRLGRRASRASGISGTGIGHHGSGHSIVGHPLLLLGRRQGQRWLCDAVAAASEGQRCCRWSVVRGPAASGGQRRGNSRRYGSFVRSSGAPELRSGPPLGKGAAAGGRLKFLPLHPDPTAERPLGLGLRGVASDVLTPGLVWLEWPAGRGRLSGRRCSSALSVSVESCRGIAPENSTLSERRRVRVGERAANGGVKGAAGRARTEPETV